MKIRVNNKYIRWGLTAFLVIAAAILFYYLLFHGMNIRAALKTATTVLSPIIMGMVMAYLMTPILNYLEYHIFFPLCTKLKIKETKKRNGIIRGISIIFTVVLSFAIIYLVIAMLVSQIVPSITKIVSNFDSYINNFMTWINRIFEDEKYADIGNNIIDMLDKYSIELEAWLNGSVLPKTTELIKTVSLSVIGILKVLWNFLIGLMICIYVLAGKERFAGQAKKLTYALFQTETANIIINNFRFTHRTFIGFLSGKILDSLIIGMLCFVGTSWMQTPYAALVSVVIGVTNIIPVFGPYLGAIPSIVLIFVVDPMHPLNCLYFAIFILILQQFDGNVLGPKILGDSTGLTGFWVIFAITLFGGILGVLGMFIGVPVFAVIYAAIRSFAYTALRNKNIPTDTKAYINVALIDENGKIYEYIPEYRLKKIEKEKVIFGKEFLYHVDSDKLNKYKNIDATPVADIGVSKEEETTENKEVTKK